MKVDFTTLSPNRVGALIEKFQTTVRALPVWHDSEEKCALSDAERHLGHIIRVGDNWIAYDGTRLNTSHDGFRVVGIFPTLDAAKSAVEQAVRVLRSRVKPQRPNSGFFVM